MAKGAADVDFDRAALQRSVATLEQDTQNVGGLLRDHDLLLRNLAEQAKRGGGATASPAPQRESRRARREPRATRKGRESESSDDGGADREPDLR